MDFVLGHWPEGDEDAMRRTAKHWSDMAEALKELQKPADQSMGKALSAIDGQSHAALQSYWQEIGGDNGNLANLIRVCDSFARQLEHGAADIEHAKLTIYISLGTLVITFIPGIGTVAGAAAAVAVKLVIRRAVAELLEKLATKGAAYLAERAASRLAFRLGTGAAVGSAMGGGTDLAAQGIEMAEGHREGLDWSSVGTAAGVGAVAGSIAAPIGAKMLDGMANVVGRDVLESNSLGGIVSRAVSEVPGNVIGNTAGSAVTSGGHVDTSTLFEGAGGGLSRHSPENAGPHVDSTPHLDAGSAAAAFTEPVGAGPVSVSARDETPTAAPIDTSNAQPPSTDASSVGASTIPSSAMPSTTAVPATIDTPAIADGPSHSNDTSTTAASLASTSPTVQDAPVQASALSAAQETLTGHHAGSIESSPADSRAAHQDSSGIGNLSDRSTPVASQQSMNVGGAGLPVSEHNHVAGQSATAASNISQSSDRQVPRAAESTATSSNTASVDRPGQPAASRAPAEAPGRVELRAHPSDRSSLASRPIDLPPALVDDGRPERATASTSIDEIAGGSRQSADSAVTRGQTAYEAPNPPSTRRRESDDATGRAGITDRSHSIGTNPPASSTPRHSDERTAGRQGTGRYAEPQSNRVPERPSSEIPDRRSHPVSADRRTDGVGQSLETNLSAPPPARDARTGATFGPDEPRMPRQDVQSSEAEARSHLRRFGLPVEDEPYYNNPHYRDYSAAYEYSRRQTIGPEAADLRARQIGKHPELAELSTAEVDLIRRNQFLRLNESVNNATRNGDVRALEQYDTEIRALVTAYNKMPDHVGVVYRSLYIDDPVKLEKFLEDYKPGSTPRDPGFGVADKGASNPGGNIELVIDSRYGKDVSWASYQQDDVVFPPGNMFYVEKVSHDDGKYVIHLIDLGRNPDAHLARGNETNSHQAPRSYDGEVDGYPRKSRSDSEDGRSSRRIGEGGSAPGHRRSDPDLASMDRIGAESDRTREGRHFQIAPTRVDDPASLSATEARESAQAPFVSRPLYHDPAHVSSTEEPSSSRRVRATDVVAADEIHSSTSAPNLRSDASPAYEDSRPSVSGRSEGALDRQNVPLRTDQFDQFGVGGYRHPGGAPEPLTHREIQDAHQIQQAREYYRLQIPENGSATHVRGGRGANAGPAYEFRRYPAGSGQSVGVVSIRVHLSSDHLSLEQTRHAWENAQLAADLMFNRGHRLLSGDWVLIDLVPTLDPSAADMHIRVDDTPGSLHPYSLATQLRDQLSLPATSDPTRLSPEDLRRLSNEIAEAHTPAALEGLPEARVFGPGRLQPVERAEYQHAVEDALRDGNQFLVYADPRTNPYGRLINDGGPERLGRNVNCIDSALAALSSFNGRPQVSAPIWIDRLPNGKFDEAAARGESPERIAAWIGGAWENYQDGRAIPEQYQALHERMRQDGPGSSALVGTLWPIRDANGAIVYNADGTPQIGAGHATVIVYPRDATGPVWWDPQDGTFSDQPPRSLTDQSVGLLFMTIDSDRGDHAATATPDHPTSPAVPVRDLRHDNTIPSDPVRARMGVPPEGRTGRYIDQSGDGFAEPGREQAERRSDDTSQPRSDHDREDVRRGDSNGPAHRGTTDLPPTVAFEDPKNPGELGGDRVPRSSAEPDPASTGSRGLSTEDQQAHSRVPSVFSDRDERRVVDGMEKPSERHVADGGDLRGLTAASVEGRGATRTPSLWPSPDFEMRGSKASEDPEGRPGSSDDASRSPLGDRPWHPNPYDIQWERPPDSGNLRPSVGERLGLPLRQEFSPQKADHDYSHSAERSSDAAGKGAPDPTANSGASDPARGWSQGIEPAPSVPPLRPDLDNVSGLNPPGHHSDASPRLDPEGHKSSDPDDQRAGSRPTPEPWQPYSIPDGSSSDKPVPAIPERDDLPPPKGWHRGADDLLHQPGDRPGSYRTRDGRLHDISDPLGTFRDSKYMLHDEQGSFVSDHLASKDVSFKAMPEASWTHTVENEELRQQILSTSEERLKQQGIDQNLLLAHAQRTMLEFGITDINDLKLSSLDKKIAELSGQVYGDHTLSASEKEAKIVRLYEMMDTAEKYHQLNVDKIAASKYLGDLGGAAFQLDRFPEAITITPYEGAFDGNKTVDRAAFLPANEHRPPTFLIFENKGVGSDLESADTPVGRAEQCSPEHTARTLEIDQNIGRILSETPEQMLARGIDPQSIEGQRLLQAKQELLTAFQQGTLQYEVYKVHTDINGNVTVTSYGLVRDGVPMRIENIGGIARVPTPFHDLVTAHEQELTRSLAEQLESRLSSLQPGEREIVELALDFASGRPSHLLAVQEFVRAREAMDLVWNALENEGPLAEISAKIDSARGHLELGQRIEFENQLAALRDLDLADLRPTAEQAVRIGLEERNAQAIAQLVVAERQLIHAATERVSEFRAALVKERSQYIQHHLNRVRELEGEIAQGKSPELSVLLADLDSIDRTLQYEQQMEARALDEIGLSAGHRERVEESLAIEHARALEKARQAYSNEIVRQVVSKVAAARELEGLQRELFIQKIHEQAQAIERAIDLGIELPNPDVVLQAHKNIQQAIQHERNLEDRQLEVLGLSAEQAAMVVPVLEAQRIEAYGRSVETIAKEAMRLEHNRTVGVPALQLTQGQARTMDPELYALVRTQDPVDRNMEKGTLVYQMPGQGRVEIPLNSLIFHYGQVAKNIDRGLSPEMALNQFLHTVGQADPSEAVKERPKEPPHVTRARELELQRALELRRELGRGIG
ncbi:toxin glutamine deamidase domain-containing protein [Nocardia sp. NPDC004068]|uniref:toxin glutamine deamidase domain-containing protein n=1 Tax=Nocardia sp. NPDC004068 TaxID=3364303 RepID=UPI003695E2CD